MTTFTIVPQGRFSLRESVEFGFGQRHAERFAGVMRLAFALDDGTGHAGVVLRQDGSGAVHGRIAGAPVDEPAAVDAVCAQVARVLSLDHDGTAFDGLGAQDPTLGQLLERAPGLRPPLFYSPYEAAVWSVLSARRPANQMAEVRRRLSVAHGRVFTLDGVELAALPTPEQLLRVKDFPGLNEEKVARMHGIARAAVNGDLAVDRLRTLGPQAAVADLQHLKGIGPLYANLIVIRSVGFTDVLPTDEPILKGLVAQLYALPGPPDVAEFTALAAPWQPFRTWAGVLIRATAHRVLDGDAQR